MSLVDAKLLRRGRPGASRRVLLVLAPFFTPLTPPLGIAQLSAYLRGRGHELRCVDLNVRPELWRVHREYFDTLTRHDPQRVGDGHSKLWHVMHAQYLAQLRGAPSSACEALLAEVLPLFDVPWTRALSRDLTQIGERYFAQLERAVDELPLGWAEFVGVSTYTTSMPSALALLRRAKTVTPGITTIMGGGVFADDFAYGSDNLALLLAEHDYVDHVVLGEGEVLLADIVEQRTRARCLPEVHDVEPGEVLATPMALSDIPLPDFSDFEIGAYHQLAIAGGRSCPFQCSFCSETIQWGPYRKLGKGVLADQMIELAARYGKRDFFMSDSLMNPYIMNLSQTLLERDAQLTYDGYLRADPIAIQPERVRAWARSGLRRVRLGIESAAPAVLSAMDKRTSPDTISAVLQTLAEAGIRTTTYWLVGHPDEREQDFAETLEFIHAHAPFIYEVEAHPFYYYPYGQVASRQYESVSLFPDDISSLIGFRSWEVRDVTPNRRERYERLRRISGLASALGVPNIYTLAERIDAEDRWLALHPRARSPHARAGVATARPARAAARASDGATHHLDLVVSEGLDEALLGRAWSFVLAHHGLTGEWVELDADVAPSTAALRLRARELDEVSLAHLAEDLRRAYIQLEEDRTPSLPSAVGFVAGAIAHPMPHELSHELSRGPEPAVLIPLSRACGRTFPSLRAVLESARAAKQLGAVELCLPEDLRESCGLPARALGQHCHGPELPTTTGSTSDAPVLLVARRRLLASPWLGRGRWTVADDDARAAPPRGQVEVRRRGSGYVLATQETHADAVRELAARIDAWADAAIMGRNHHTRTAISPADSIDRFDFE